jgi:hypothetical protein
VDIQKVAARLDPLSFAGIAGITSITEQETPILSSTSSVISLLYPTSAQYNTSELSACYTALYRAPDAGITEQPVANSSADASAIAVIPVIPSLVKGPHVSATPNLAPLTQQYPCVVCSGSERWDDHGIWRRVACWPREESRTPQAPPHDA